jgi:hypothetical protein
VTGRARRIGAVLLMALTASAGMLLVGGPAEAHHCDKPNETGNVVVNVGGVGTVGVDQNNVGTLEHDVVVCADPPHQETTVDVRDLDPAGWGAEVGAGTCGPLGCTGVGYTGVEVTSTRLWVDGPFDGSNTVGTDADPTVCPWVNGAQQPCQTDPPASTSGGEAPPLPPVHSAVDPFANYMYYESLYGVPNYGLWCVDFMFDYDIQWGTALCTVMVVNRLVFGPLDALGVL